jgi:hypothetical protein
MGGGQRSESGFGDQRLPCLIPEATCMVLSSFDIYEKLPKGSLVWRTCAFGKYQAERKLQDLAEHSENEFFAIDIQTGELWPPNAAKGLRRAVTNALNG